jgi:Pyridoxamine 5'-phosphate oxidase
VTGEVGTKRRGVLSREASSAGRGGGLAVRIVEKTVSNNHCAIFDLEEFLSRPLYAHLATGCAHGPRESPVWFFWDGKSFWIIGGETFPENLKADPRCALGIVDWDLSTGKSQHVGVRGRAEVLPFDPTMVMTIFGRYFGPEAAEWDPRFRDVISGEAGVEMVRVTPETVVMRDQSYRPTAWMRSQPGGRSANS